MTENWVVATIDALSPLRDPGRATDMTAYMKNVSEFLGVPAPARRSAQARAWKPLGRLDEDELSRVCDALWNLDEREYHYAACDLIAKHQSALSASFLPNVTQRLLTSKAWWDTVDSLGSAAVTPLVQRHHLVDLMWTWIESGDRWLIRAAVQHQRGLKQRTDLPRLFAMCDRVADDREFFIAKAVGWALRDAAALSSGAVQSFVDQHPTMNAVARREATKGLARSTRP